MPEIKYASVSEIGNRTNNEDCIAALVQAPQAFFAVADGLGGHGKGEVASQLAVNKALEAYAQSEGGVSPLSVCFEYGQQAILLEQQQLDARGDMKTTLALLTIKGNQAQWGHIGDTRLYWFVGNRLQQRTLDHSVPQMLVATGEIREKDIRKHEDRNRLLRVMGIEWSSPRYEIAEKITLTGNDSFLLCTDGFWEYVNEKVMQHSLRAAQTANAWLQAMLAEAERNSRGCDRDNYSAIAVFIR